MNEWFIPEPEDFPSHRALLHLGLNKAVRYYRELIVPGIGGTIFVRQFSWAAAGIALAKELKRKPAKIANGIEALACKLEWKNNKDEYNGRGKRAFNRDINDVWSFKELSNEKHYVQVTYRMSTVRALAGLCLTTGTRFNTMELTKTGNTLAETLLNQSGVGKGSGTINNALKKWINGKEILHSGKIVQCLGKSGVTNEEKEIIRNRLMADSIGELSNFQRRTYLIKAFGRNKINMPELDIIKKKLKKQKRQDYVKNIETAIAFDAMLECGRTIVYKCAELIVSNVELFQNKDLCNELKKLRSKIKAFQNTKGKKHEDADAFVNLMQEKGDAKLLKNIAERDGSILTLSNGNIIKGPLFDRRKDIENDNENPDKQDGSEESSTERKIRQLFALWGDCN